MALMELKIDPLEVTAIRKALEEIVVLLRAKLMADGYLQPQPDRKPTTLEDVRVVGVASVWNEQKRQKQQVRRMEQGLTESQ